MTFYQNPPPIIIPICFHCMQETSPPKEIYNMKHNICEEFFCEKCNIGYRALQSTETGFWSIDIIILYKKEIQIHNYLGNGETYLYTNLKYILELENNFLLLHSLKEIHKKLLTYLIFS